MQTNQHFFNRMVLTTCILLSGMVLLPYIDMPKTTLGWELFAGVYQPELLVEEPSGQPGSTFTFSGSNYPANSLATVYVDGQTIGTIMTDQNGETVFYINTMGSSLGLYNITAEVDANASATSTMELSPDAPLLPPPNNPAGPIFHLGYRIFMPILIN